MFTRLCRGPTFQTLGSLQKLNYVRNVPNQTVVRLYVSEGRDAAARAARRATLKEKIMQPTTGKRMLVSKRFSIIYYIYFLYSLRNWNRSFSRGFGFGHGSSVLLWFRSFQWSKHTGQLNVSVFMWKTN